MTDILPTPLSGMTASDAATAWKLVPVEPTEAEVEAATVAYINVRGNIQIGMRAAIIASRASAPSPAPLTDAELRDLWMRYKSVSISTPSASRAVDDDVLAFGRAVESRIRESKP
jgi:hypothetical protein